LTRVRRLSKQRKCRGVRPKQGESTVGRATHLALGDGKVLGVTPLEAVVARADVNAEELETVGVGGEVHLDDVVDVEREAIIARLGIDLVGEAHSAVTHEERPDLNVRALRVIHVARHERIVVVLWEQQVSPFQSETKREKKDGYMK